MRAVLQRVKEARVLVEGLVVGEIGTGILALVGVETGDGEADVKYIADRIADLRLFDGVTETDPERSLTDIAGSALIVSQFTLLGDCRKGRRPSWSAAAAPAEGKRQYEAVVQTLRERGIPVETGTFRAHMDVQSSNDGPFTVLVDSRKTF